MQRSLIAGHNNQRHLSSDEFEHNVGGLPVTDNRIRELFNSLDVGQRGVVSVESVKDFYLGIEHFGLIPSDAEAERKVRKYVSTHPDSLTYDEFACFVLEIARW
ncbi:hypothetical protein AGDE_00705 [Angomonas deanei]|uniref:EF-hand domain-containing protein n=1 Tax=Angomonas deanei TaxID=59799 RepID=S9WSN3_9TRYP|nr:hypothetical protein AGDE_04939 [Angomonas deanei]EPY43217.1 hypothetical protein AGDE_00705 [Angomonas deanei]CAD2212890.1 hypothetical protein, conserved [Angomonas deanei]|eukprot:EPY38990.1 hypothetical protein AGDE_04939 [Angomonas deanei]